MADDLWHAKCREIHNYQLNSLDRTRAPQSKSNQQSYRYSMHYEICSRCEILTETTSLLSGYTWRYDTEHTRRRGCFEIVTSRMH